MFRWLQQQAARARDTAARKEDVLRKAIVHLRYCSMMTGRTRVPLCSGLPPSFSSFSAVAGSSLDRDQPIQEVHTRTGNAWRRSSLSRRMPCCPPGKPLDPPLHLALCTVEARGRRSRPPPPPNTQGIAVSFGRSLWCWVFIVLVLTLLCALSAVVSALFVIASSAQHDPSGKSHNASARQRHQVHLETV